MIQVALATGQRDDKTLAWERVGDGKKGEHGGEGQTRGREVRPVHPAGA
jgi:hypothetical protein